MVKKRKRKFILACVLALSIRSTEVNADWFVDGFLFNQNPARPRVLPKCGGSHGILSRLAASAGSDIQNNGNNGSYFDQSLNCEFTNKQIQKKFDDHESQFGVTGNYNSVNRELFRKALIKHMHENLICIGTYRSKPVYHYYNPDNNLNVMVNRNNNKFISGWRLNNEQIENMERNGNIQ